MDYTSLEGPAQGSTYSIHFEDSHSIDGTELSSEDRPTIIEHRSIYEHLCAGLDHIRVK